MGASILLIVLSAIMMFRNTQSILGALIVLIAVWALTIDTRNKILEAINLEKERFPATEINYTGIIRSIPWLILLILAVHGMVFLFSSLIGNWFWVNLFLWISYGVESLVQLRKSTLKQLGYSRKEIRDILRKEEEEKAMKEYEKKHGKTAQK